MEFGQVQNWGCEGAKVCGVIPTLFRAYALGYCLTSLRDSKPRLQGEPDRLHPFADSTRREMPHEEDDDQHPAGFLDVSDDPADHCSARLNRTQEHPGQGTTVTR